MPKSRFKILLYDYLEELD